MPAFTDSQAQAYYQTLTPEQRQAVDASGGPSVAWFTNAVNAGVPEAIRATGQAQQAEENSGGYMGAGGNSADWVGKRTPTPSELRQYAQEQKWSEDFARYDDRQLAAWLQSSWNPTANKFSNQYGDLVEKPTETGANAVSAGAATGQGGRGAGGGGGGGVGAGGQGTYGGAPGFNFTAPSWQEAMNDPGYQFALQQGNKSLQGSAAAGGVLRTSGTLKDLMNYGQDMATQQYGNVYNRQYALAKDQFAPQYGSWQTTYDAALRKYLQREQNIYGLVNSPEPGAPSYTY